MSRWWKMPQPHDSEWTNILSWGANNRTNLCLQSEDLSTTWNTVSAAVTTNAVAAPDGSITADKITDAAGEGAPTATYVNQAITLTDATEYTYSVFVKAAGLDWAYIWFDRGTTNVACFFDLANIAVGTASGITTDDVGIEDYGNGWRRIWLTATTNGTSCRVRIYPADADTDATVDQDGTSSIYAWGAQIETASSLTPYISTTTTSRTISGNGRTNILKNSNDFEGALWTQPSSTVTADYAIAPDGSQTAARIVSDTTGGRVVSAAVTTTSEDRLVGSIYCKAIDMQDELRVTLMIYNKTTAGTIRSSASEGGASVGNYTEGEWVRIELSAESTDGVGWTTGDEIYLYYYNGDTSNPAGNEAYIWGAQLEHTDGVATQYIPTVTVAVTDNQTDNFIDEVHRCLETITEDTGSLDDLYKKYKRGH